MKSLEVSESTYKSFMEFKKAVEESSGEEVTVDEVLDFMIRAILSSVEISDEENGDGNQCSGEHGHCCGSCQYDH